MTCGQTMLGLAHEHLVLFNIGHSFKHVSIKHLFYIRITSQNYYTDNLTGNFYVLNTKQGATVDEIKLNSLHFSQSFAFKIK